MTSSARRTEGVVARRVRSVEARDTPASASISRFEEERGAAKHVARRSLLLEVMFSSVGAHDFFVHIQRGLRQPLLHTGMQLHTGTYARLVYTASPLPSLRVLRQWYSLRVRGWDTGPARHAAAFVRARYPGAGGQASVGDGRFQRGAGSRGRTSATR